MAEKGEEISSSQLIRKDSLQSITSTSSSVVESFKSAASTFVESVTSSISEDWQTATSLSPGGDVSSAATSADEYFSAEEDLQQQLQQKLQQTSASLLSNLQSDLLQQSSSNVQSTSSSSVVKKSSSSSVTSSSSSVQVGDGGSGGEPTLTEFKEVSKATQKSDVTVSKSDSATGVRESKSVSTVKAVDTKRELVDAKTGEIEEESTATETTRHSSTKGALQAAEGGEEDALVKQMKEVGENVTKMLEAVNVKQD